MLSYLIVYWNVVYLICCVLLNFASLIVHLGTWRSRYRGRTSRTEVSAPAAVTVFYLISVNLLYLSLCKLPLLHSQWFLNFRFSEIICYVIVVLTESFECVQTVSIAILCVVLWHRQKTKNYHRQKQDVQDMRKEYRLANGLGQGCLVIFLSGIYCLVVGICASHRFLSSNSVSPLTDVSRNDFNSTVDLKSMKVSVCKAQVPRYDNPPSSHLWEMSFRWIIGFGSPLLFMALPSMLHLNFRLLRRQKKIKEEDDEEETNKGENLLNCYVRFCLAVLWIDFLLRLPSLIHDISLWTSDNSQNDISAKAASVDYKFVLYILTIIFPELRLLYFPLGTLILLPGGRQRRKSRSNFGAKNEIGSEKEIESFVVSTSTVAIETLPSRVRIPEPKLNCFNSGKRKSFEVSSTSVIQKE